MIRLWSWIEESRWVTLAWFKELAHVHQVMGGVWRMELFGRKFYRHCHMIPRAIMDFF
jgi:hypothetical protein